MDCSPPGSSVHGILQARILAGVSCHSLLQGIFRSQGLNPHLLHCWQILYSVSRQGSPSRTVKISLWLLLQYISPSKYYPHPHIYRVKKDGFFVLLSFSWHLANFLPLDYVIISVHTMQ